MNPMRSKGEEGTVSTPKVLVLMTTYNGQKYVAEQIESILNQQGVEVELRICDDCSTDDTYSVLEAVAAENLNVRVSCNTRNKGVIRNFMDLIYTCDAQAYDYVAISDQDDIWYPNKLQVASMHITSNTSRPELYYAGVNNVDTQGNSLGNEYLPYKVCAEHTGSLLLVQNWCLGCTTLMNPALVKLLQAHPVYDFVRMYDAWIHAVALYCGGFVCCDLDHYYIDRRITGENTVGVMNEKRTPIYIAKKAVDWVLHKDAVTSRKHTKLAKALLREYRSEMDEDTIALVQAVAERETSAKARRFLFRRKDICMTTPLRTRWLRWMVLMNKF